jgi:tRNA-2-methylthio-N6-dimethylallyladenosine synthase
MTSHPKDLSDELIETMAEMNKVCDHLHLPVQSGSDRVLQQMNRRYTRAQYVSLVEKLRASNPNIELTTDIIVGFPSETEEDFLDTLSLVEEIVSRLRSSLCTLREAVRWKAGMAEQIRQIYKKERLLHSTACWRQTRKTKER